MTRLPLFANATDADSNATITITSLTVESFPFTVHSTTGAVTVAGSLDHETQSVYNFFVIATDEFEFNSAPASLNITVFDGDDNVPMFGMTVYDINVEENRTQGYLVTTLTAIDVDNTAGPILYKLQQQSPVLPFAIEATTGNITVNGTLDYESGFTNYQFIVFASSNNFVTKGNATVNIAILDINDRPPVFNAKVYNATVDENSIQDILQVNAADADTNAVIRYQLLSGNTSFFEINDITGVIRTSQELDYEQYQELQLVVLAFNPDNPNLNSTTKVEIQIIDVSDNSPIFSPSSYSVSVPEFASSGHVVVTTTASDADNYDTVTYSIGVSIPTTNIFIINETTGTITVHNTTLPSRQQTSTYVLQISARDGGSPPRESTTLVLITVTDVNEQPVFTHITYTVKQLENTPIGTSVLQVEATETGDVGTNSKITYSIAGYTLDPSVFPFHINSSSGEISLQSSLDYEQNTSWVFSVVAEDDGAMRLNDTATVTVVVGDVNDNAPVFSKAVYKADVKEGSSGGDFVILVTAHDADSLPNAMITYNITSGNTDNIFAIDPSNGIVTVAGTINHEQNSTHTLVITAVDSENPQLSNNTSVVITVVDIKDNSPVFTATQFIGVINETAQIGDPVLDSMTRLPLFANATDADSNATITITSLTVGSFPFTVHSTTGAVTVAGSLDHETQSVYNFFVIATDEFEFSSAPASLNITVFDGDDNVPMFGMTVYDIDVEENRTQGYLVTTLTAIDVDNTAGPILYKLQQQSPVLPFAIEATTGNITVNGTLDYESGFTNYQFIVFASSNNFVTKGNATVNIAILDINDRPPVFNAKVYNATVDENSIQDILQVNAADADTNAVIRYQLLSGNTSFFEINDITGVIRTSQELDYEQYQELQLVVLAFNPDNPNLNSTTKVEIQIIDVNDNSPIFSPSSYSVSVPEFASSGHVVVTVTASDADTYHTVTYSIGVSIPTTNIFIINETTGTITVHNTTLPSRQQTSTYVLQISAHDGGSPPRESTTLVLITVTDVNEQPVFTHNTYTVKQPEDTPIGTIVLQVEATETGDIGTNSIITYSIVGYASVFPFHINSSCGEISLQSSLDYEQNTSWVFLVVAEDDGAMRLSDTATVTVVVGDVNDNAPVFDENPFYVFVNETLPIGSIVTNVINATDADTVSEGNLRYCILSGGFGKFIIDESTGVITLVNNLDVETYTVQVQVSDGKFEVETNLSLQVIDQNNHKPVFLIDVFTASFPEEELPGHYIMQITAMDADETNGQGDVFYRLINNDNFTINQTSGELFTYVTFDFETGPNQYNLTVEAYDGGTPPQSASAAIFLTVTDINDNTPYFTNDSYEAELREGLYIQEYVTKITALDKDSGTNAEIVYDIVYSNVSSLFMISDEGILTASGAFDYDHPEYTPCSYALIITATDGGYPPRTENTSVVISIIDINDNAPVFPYVSIQFLVPENSAVNQTLFTIKATDFDSGINGLIRYQINSTYSASCMDTYSIDADSGNITLAKSIDFESPDTDLQCSLFVIARDLGDPSRSSDVTILAHITNVNELSPVILGELNISVAENTPPGTIIYTIMSVDHDMNSVTYEITDEVTTIFSINATSGEVSVAPGAVLDYEMTVEYSITVIATDDGTPSRSSSSALFISITDENDEPPVFEQAAYHTSIREQTSVGSTILITRATDKDSPPNAQISYKFVLNSDGETNYGKFAVNSSTGHVTVSASLDYETEQQFYYMLMQASDGVNKQTVQVNVRVLESNDNSPIFVNLPNTTSISESTENNTFVFKVHATDSDLLENGRIVYSLNDTKFRIEPETGVIRVQGNGQFDFDKGIREYTIIVIASDSAGTKPNGSNAANNVSGFGPNTLTNLNDSVLSTSRELVIAITDVNDNAPQFLQEEYAATVWEHEFNEIAILQVTAQDNDEMGTERSKIRYAIVSGDFGHFEINNVSGVIKSIPPIDREADLFFELIVKAYDLGLPSLSSSVLVNITIIDSDDEAPRFLRKIYNANLIENSPEGTFVVKVTAIDSDYDTTINYTVFDQLGHFVINGSGVITTTSSPVDRESTPHITLSVIAADGRGLFNTTTIIITVIDVNDNRPSFQHNNYFFNISESTPMGSFVMGPSPAILATDDDTGEYSVTEYLLYQTSGQLGRFRINPVTGVIEVIGSLCFTDVPFQIYGFTVTAIDIDSFKNDTAQLLIIVHEENNFSPLFTRPSYVGRLNKIAKIGTIVISSLLTTDQDICSGKPVFNIAAGNLNNTFEINSTTGRITLARNLTKGDFSFTLTLTATDTKNVVLQNRTGIVRLIVLVGQLLPVSIRTDRALTVPTISKKSQTVYQQELWVHNGGELSSSSNVTYMLGSTEVNRTIQLEAAEAVSITAILVSESVYPDRNTVMVALQVTGNDYEQAYVEDTEVYITLVSPAGIDTPVFSNCTTNGSGSYCLAGVAVPLSWFDATTYDIGSGSGAEQLPSVSVLFGLDSEQNMQTKIGDVSLISRPACTIASNINELRVLVPIQVNYPGETLDIQVTANTEYDIISFRFSCESEEGISFTKVSSKNGFVIATELNDTTAYVSGINTDPHDQTITEPKQLVTIGITINESLHLDKEKYFNLSCHADYVVNTRMQESISQSSASHTSLMQPSCEAEYAGILVAPKAMRGIFAYASSNSILNTAKLNGEKVSVNVTTVGVYITGEFIIESELDCNASAPLKMTSDCKQVYQDGTESTGSNYTSIIITGRGDTTATILFRVWYPAESSIVTETYELHRIGGVLSSNCSNLYEKTNVYVEVVFQAGEGLTQTAVLTELLQDNLFSSNPNVTELLKTNHKVRAIGKLAGTTKLELRHSENGLLVNELELVVSDVPVTVEDLSFNLHTSLVPAELEVATAGSQYNENAMVEIITDLRYLNTPVVVVTDAILSNGHNFEFSPVENLHLTSEDKEVITVSRSDEITVRGSGSGLLLRGNWTVCNGHSLYSTAELISVSLVNVSSIEAIVGEDKIAVNQHAGILNRPNSTSVTANIIHIDGKRVDVTNDSRTTFYDSEDLLTFSHGLVGISANTVQAITELSSILSTNVTVRYQSTQIDTSITVGPIQIVSIVGIKLKTYPYPGWNGAGPITTLRRYAGTTSFQKAQLQLLAILNNGEQIDITDSSDVLFNIKNNGSEAEINENILTVNTGDFLVNITAEVAEFYVETSINVSNDLVMVSNITHFDIGIEDTFSGYRKSKAFVKTVGLVFNDQSRIPNLIGDNGPIIDGLVHFTSSDNTIINIHNSSGEMTLIQNSHSPVQISVTASNIQVTKSQSLYANLVPILGDADFGKEIGSPLPLLDTNASFTLPIYVNTENTLVGAIELRVIYTESVLELTSRPLAPSTLSHALFESSYNDVAGEARFGIVFQNITVGEARMEVGSLTFNVKCVGSGFISVDVITLNTYNTTIDDIGSPTPRRSLPAQIIFPTASANPESTTVLSSTPSTLTRCNYPPCSSEQCIAIAGEMSGADANADCLFDLLDVLVTLKQSAIGNSLSISPEQIRAMDADKNGRISTLDAQMLMKANFDIYPFISDIAVRPVDAEFSNCVLAINMTLNRKIGAVQDNTYVIFGLFHSSSDFQNQYDATNFSIGSKQTGPDLPQGAYGGWIIPEYQDNGTYSIRTNHSSIAQVDIGFLAVYADIRNIESRSFTVIGKPTPPVSFRKLVTTINVSESYVKVSLLDGFNAQTVFNNSFNADQCFNNHTPKTNLSGVYNVSENIAINSTILNVTASDGDSGPSGQLRYRLDNLTQPGTLDIDSVTGELYTAAILDYEKYTEINVTVVVTDQGPHISTRKSATLQVILTIIDVNDNPPVPEQSVYAINVSEGTTTPSGNLLNVTAHDNDTSLQFRNFHFEFTNEDHLSSKFVIGLHDGQLLLNDTLDRETQDFYNLTVQINDTSSPANSLTATTHIEVTVTDINDNRPLFLSKETATISENNSIGDVLYQADASDLDYGTNGEVFYSITSISEADDSGNETVPIKFPDELFSIDPINGTLQAQTVLDREGLHSFIITINATDKGIEPLSTTLNLWVQVCELNDNAPQFSEPEGYIFFINENTASGTVFGTSLRLLSSDKDLGSFCTQDTSNAQDNVIEYELENDDEITAFAVRDSGEIVVIGDIDYEMVQEVILEITAFDLGDPQLETNTTVTIVIQDLNEKPSFDRLIYETSVSENAEVGTELDIEINIADQDSGKNGTFNVSLSGDRAEDFEINETGISSTGIFTGIISVRHKLKQSHYQLKIIAIDEGSPPLSSTAELNIAIDDINDNLPEFNQSNYTTTISENTPEGMTVLTVALEDREYIRTNEVTYSLNGSYAHFRIDPTSGEIYPNSKSYVSKNTTYTFIVVASDPSVVGSTTHASTNATVIINVYNETSVSDVIFVWAIIAIAVFTTVILITILVWILVCLCARYMHTCIT